MLENTVFDILVYVFDHYMFEELPVSAERADIARDLEIAGFRGANVERALDWLADLADERERPGLKANERAFRLYSAEEAARLDSSCQGLLRRFLRGIQAEGPLDRKSTRLNSSHTVISYAVFC